MGEPAIQEIVCCLGQPVAGNPSQFMMERAFRAAGLDWRYLTLEVAAEGLEEALRGLCAMGFRGANLARPHLAPAVSLVDRLSESAARIGAVNCVKREDGELVGENSVGKGFVASLAEVTPIADKEFVLLGAGSAARAIAIELAGAGAGRITVVNRTVERGRALAEQLAEWSGVDARYVPWETSWEIPSSADVVVQATSIGCGDPAECPPILMESLDPRQVVADVVLQPARTAWLRRAEQRGCQTLDALGMFVHQRAFAFEWWTGVEPDRGVMREALEEFLEV